MIKTPISLQDLRRRIYVKAKTEPTWRFWGLYVHVCKMEMLQEAYQMAKSNKGALGIDGVTFDAIEESGVESFLKQIQDLPSKHTCSFSDHRRSLYLTYRGTRCAKFYCCYLADLDLDPLYLQVSRCRDVGIARIGATNRALRISLLGGREPFLCLTLNLAFIGRREFGKRMYGKEACLSCFSRTTDTVPRHAIRKLLEES